MRPASAEMSRKCIRAFVDGDGDEGPVVLAEVALDVEFGGTPLPGAIWPRQAAEKTVTRMVAPTRLIEKYSSNPISGSLRQNSSGWHFEKPSLRNFPNDHCGLISVLLDFHV